MYTLQKLKIFCSIDLLLQHYQLENRLRGVHSRHQQDMFGQKEKKKTNYKQQEEDVGDKSTVASQTCLLIKEVSKHQGIFDRNNKPKYKALERILLQRPCTRPGI